MIAHLLVAFSSILTEGSYLVLFLFVAILTILVYVLFGDKRKDGTHPPLPRPWRFPIFGNLPQLAPFPHEALTKFGKTFGDVFAVRLGSWDVLVINSLSAAREALFQKSAFFSSRPPFFTLRLSNSQDYTVAFGDYNPAQVIIITNFIMRQWNICTCRYHLDHFGLRKSDNSQFKKICKRSTLYNKSYNNLQASI